MPSCSHRGCLMARAAHPEGMQDSMPSCSHRGCLMARAAHPEGELMLGMDILWAGCTGNLLEFEIHSGNTLNLLEFNCSSCEFCIIDRLSMIV